MWEAAYTASNYVGFEVVDSDNGDVESHVCALQGNGKILLVYHHKDCELEFVRKDTW